MINDSMNNRPSSSAKRHPNFFIVGAAKSGTTSLWQYLREHPDIFMSQNKEPGYFCHSQGIKNYEKYLKLFSEATTETALGEASHAYLTSQESAAWIHAIYPDIKIIVILRNPVDRAYSLYNWMTREGYEPILPFEKAVDAEESRIADTQFKKTHSGPLQNYLYFHSGLYSAQLKRYFNIFPEQQMHVILYDELKENPVATAQKVYEFLGVDTSFTPSTGIHNKGQIPASVTAQYLIRKYLTYLKKLHVPSAVKIRQSVLNINVRLGKNLRHELDVSTRNNLTALYRDDILATSRLIERDLSSWLEKAT